MSEPAQPPTSNLAPGSPQVTNERPQALDAAALARQARRLAAAEQAPWLHGMVAQRMAERLGFVKLRPRQVLDVSAWWGASESALRVAYPEAQLLWSFTEPQLAARSRQALSKPWWTAWKRAARTHWREGAGEPLELVWANLLLHTQADLPATLAAWSAQLKVGGFVMFSCLGPDSFIELRRLYQAQHWGRPAPEWWDMHDLGDLMGRAGFADPVMDQERLSLTWGDAQSLLNDLRALGGNVAPLRFAGLRTPRWRERLLAGLETLRGADGRLRLTLELVYGHAFKAQPRHAVAPETRIGLDEMRASLRPPRHNTGKA